MADQPKMTPVEAALIIADSQAGLITKLAGKVEEAMLTLSMELKTLRTEGGQVLQFLAAEVRRLQKREAELATGIEDLASYANTVEPTRRDKTGQFSLQTVEWCEGLIECVNKAAALLPADRESEVRS